MWSRCASVRVFLPIVQPGAAPAPRERTQTQTWTIEDAPALPASLGAPPARLAHL